MNEIKIREDNIKEKEILLYGKQPPQQILSPYLQKVIMIVIIGIVLAIFIEFSFKLH